MAENPAAIVPLLRSVLTDPNTEQIVQKQMIDLARRNLHSPEVLAVLLETLPQVKDAGVRKILLELILEIDTSRFAEVETLFTTLIALFHQEKERQTRAAILERLSSALHQDGRLAAFFIDLLTQPHLSDEEHVEITAALTTLPSISQQTALQALQKAQRAPADIQALALQVAEGCPVWDEPVLAALQPYLEPRVDSGIRHRIFIRLARAKSITARYFPVLQAILRNDTDTELRSSALNLLRRIDGAAGERLAQWLWTAREDADPSLRAQAVELVKEASDISDDQLVQLLEQFHTDVAHGVRLEILGILKNRLSQPAIRLALVNALKSHPAALGDEEFRVLCEALSPYIGRDPAVREGLQNALPSLTQSARRKQLLDLLLPKLKIEENIPWIIQVFDKERDSALRQILFDRLKALTVAKFPELIRLYCRELGEPSSPFRQRCAEILAGAAAQHPDIPATLEDVLLNDTDLPLLRAALDGYLKPQVPRRFDVLLAVVKNEAFDVTARQSVLDQLAKDSVTPEQSAQVAETLAALKAGLLRWPA